MRLLTVHVGPIARVLAKRAAAESTFVAAFADKLAQHIGDAKARETFMRDMGLSP